MTFSEKHNLQQSIIRHLESKGAKFTSDELHPNRIASFYKRNGAGKFILYITNDVDVSSIETEFGVQIESVILDNGYDSPEFPAKKISI